MADTTIHVPNELFATAESSSFAGALDLDTLQAGPDAYEFAQPLSWNVLVTNTGDALLVTGTVSGEAHTQCARCLERVDVSIAGEVEGYYLLDEQQEVELDEDDEVEFDVLGPDNTIDLVPLIEAAILVDLPLQPLCKEDCAGICPTCGANLNEQTCDCAEARAAEEAAFEAEKNPFAKLRELDLNDLSD